MSVFSERLKEARTKKGLSQYYVSQELGIPRTTYANWEQGKAEPGIDMMRRLAEILEVSADYLLGLTDDPSPKSGKLPDYLKEKLEECEKLKQKFEKLREFLND